MPTSKLIVYYGEKIKPIVFKKLNFYNRLIRKFKKTSKALVEYTV